MLRVRLRQEVDSSSEWYFQARGMTLLLHAPVSGISIDHCDALGEAAVPDRELPPTHTLSATLGDAGGTAFLHFSNTTLSKPASLGDAGGRRTSSRFQRS